MLAIYLIFNGRLDASKEYGVFCVCIKYGVRTGAQHSALEPMLYGNTKPPYACVIARIQALMQEEINMPSITPSTPAAD